MLRRLLIAFLLLLLALTIVAKGRTLLRGGRTLQSAASSPSNSAPARHRSAPLALPAGLIPLLDSTTRAGVRIRLGAETERQYLDSLFSETDSIVRHWPEGGNVISYAIVPGGATGFRPEMVSEVRSALESWSPPSVGLRFTESLDTAGATLVVRWSDVLDGDRAGITDVTWDRAGRIRRADIALATRSPSTGRPLTEEIRRAVALHELGHALGLPHSSQPGDVMFPVASAATLTDRDRFSLRLLYELPMGWIGTGRPVTP